MTRKPKPKPGSKAGQPRIPSPSPATPSAPTPALTPIRRNLLLETALASATPPPPVDAKSSGTKRPLEEAQEKGGAKKVKVQQEQTMGEMVLTMKTREKKSLRFAKLRERQAAIDAKTLTKSVTKAVLTSPYVRKWFGIPPPPPPPPLAAAAAAFGGFKLKKSRGCCTYRPVTPQASQDEVLRLLSK